MAKVSRDSSKIDRARDELFSHIQRCGVLDAEEGQRDEWLDDTLEYLAERHPQLSRDDLAALRTMGQRYCSPAIRRSPVKEEAEEVDADADAKADADANADANANAEAGADANADVKADESSPAEPEAAGEGGEVQPGEVSVA